MDNNDAYDYGFIDGLRAFAYHRSGDICVGNHGITTLRDAIDCRHDLPTYRPAAPRVDETPPPPPAPFEMSSDHPLRPRMEWALELGARWAAARDLGLDPEDLARALIVGVTGEYTGKGRDYEPGQEE